MYLNLAPPNRFNQILCTDPGAWRVMGLSNYLWPEKPTFLGFLVMVSIYNNLKKVGLGGSKVGL